MSNVVYLRDVLEESPGSGGTILRKNGSKKLYVDFYYHGRRVTKSTGLDDTPANRRKIREWLDRVIERRDAGKLVFSEAFPGASDEEKAWFAQKEGWDFSPDPKTVTFGDYLDRWTRDILSAYPSEGKKKDYEEIIEARLRPYFSGMTFHQMNGVELQRFLKQLVHTDGPRKGERLSGSRVRNVFIPLRAIWSDACEEYRWNVPDPFRYVARHLPKKSKRHPEVFRFSEWERLRDGMEPYYRPALELMVRTGLIASEIAGLRVEDVNGDKLLVRNSIVKGREKSDLKTTYRVRSMPITAALRVLLDEAIARASGSYLFTMESGVSFDADNFRKHPWKRALRRAGLPYRVPYTTRHTFAAWALTVGVQPNKLVRLMGHGSKQMVYEVYGNYVEGLEGDREAIAAYLGSDFAVSG